MRLAAGRDRPTYSAAMSIAVPIDELAGRLAEYPWCFVLTVGADGRQHVMSVQPTFVNGVITADVGRSSRANAAVNPDVVLVFPPSDPAEFSLIVDAVAESTDMLFSLSPRRAVLHRPAPAAASPT